MTNHVKNLIGKKFGRLIVIHFDSIRGISKHSYWLCKCSCGNASVVRGSHLKMGVSKSCGCLNREKASKWLKKYATSSKHKGEGNPMWNGQNPKYSTIHQWLTRGFSKKQCEHCRSKNKKFDWALKKGHKHSKNRKSYLCLCRGCHLKYDYTKKRSRFMGKMLLRARIKKRRRFDRSGGIRCN